MERIFELNNYLDIDIIDLWHFRTDYGDIETAYWQAYYGIKANQDTDLIYIAGLYDHFLYLHALREYTYQAPIIIKGQQTAPNGKPYYILEIWTPGDWTNAQTHCLGYNLVYACAFRFKAKRDNALFNMRFGNIDGSIYNFYYNEYTRLCREASEND